jgi:hypothetical protein
VRDGDGTVRDIDSAFAQSVRSRHQSIHRRNSWKAGSDRTGQFASGGLLWGMATKDPSQLRIALTSVTSFPGSRELLYSLDADGLDAVCAVRLEDLSERRLTHGSERRLRYLCASPDGSRIACSVGHPDGTASIGVMRPDASDLFEVTEGESVDLAPTWVPGVRDVLVYQSAGIGRDRTGRPIGLGPFVVHRLDIPRGEVETELEEEKFDFLGPRQAADGTLYAIRRPTAASQRPSGLRVLLDIGLIPFRVLWALFQYLNFFSTRYTGKPLTTAGGPKREGPDIRQMMIWGNLIDAEQAERDAKSDGTEPPPVVPRSWELIARRNDGSGGTLARGVVSFDLAPDGSVVYSTGTAIYRRTRDGDTEKIVEDKGIEQIAVVG